MKRPISRRIVLQRSANGWVVVGVFNFLLSRQPASCLRPVWARSALIPRKAFGCSISDFSPERTNLACILPRYVQIGHCSSSHPPTHGTFDHFRVKFTPDLALVLVDGSFTFFRCDLRSGHMKDFFLHCCNGEIRIFSKSLRVFWRHAFAQADEVEHGERNPITAGLVAAEEVP